MSTQTLSVLSHKIITAIAFSAATTMLPTLYTPATAADPPPSAAPTQPVKDTAPNNTGPIK
ncbi:MAG: hypothetical protein M3Y56_07675, partial [Armatimonadota bacterium]|nr:hypothetical protein [Armatimonadota bacterium]